MASWEQALKQRFCALLGSDALQSLGHSGHWDPFAKCAARIDACHADRSIGACQDRRGIPPQELLPACLREREWDPARNDVEELAFHAGPSLVNVKLPSMFLDKEWDLSPNMVSPAAVAATLTTLDESLPHSQQRHCSFRLDQAARFGMVLEETLNPLPGGLLVVTRLDACSAFSKTAQGGYGLMAGDVIVEVNGMHGSASELREKLRLVFSVSGRRTIDLVVRARPPFFNIEVRRDGPQWNKLGMAAVFDKSNPGSLLVQGVHPEGLIPEWNAAHGSLCICKGDLITHVNDITMDVAAMKEEVKRSSAKGSRLRFRIVTPAGQALGCQKEVQEDTEDFAWPETTVPWDMQVRWLDDIDDGMTEVSTACGSSSPSLSHSRSYSSGTRTPEDTCPSGSRTPEEYCR